MIPDIDPNETVENSANYRGHNIFLSSLGKFFVVIFQLLFVRHSLKDATDLIDEMEKDKRN